MIRGFGSPNILAGTPLPWYANALKDWWTEKTPVICRTKLYLHMHTGKKRWTSSIKHPIRMELEYWRSNGTVDWGGPSARTLGNKEGSRHSSGEQHPKKVFQHEDHRRLRTSFYGFHEFQKFGIQKSTQNWDQRASRTRKFSFKPWQTQKAREKCIWILAIKWALSSFVNSSDASRLNN